ncbi:MAG: flavin reductase family protein [Chloroflexi bacterium]|nr:flavin reductase family protein [Chloroflexota bacterium]
MAKIVKSLKDLNVPFNFHYPAGATIVTSHAHGHDNAMAVAWHTAISRNPALYAVSISPKRFTHSLIAETGEFVVNFMPAEQGELVALVASCSGRDVDKFPAFHIAAHPGSHVNAPVLESAFAAYECRVTGRHTYGDHDLFLGEVLAVHYESSLFQGSGRLDLERTTPIVYLGGDWYASLEKETFRLDRQALMDVALGEPAQPARP